MSTWKEIVMFIDYDIKLYSLCDETHFAWPSKHKDDNDYSGFQSPNHIVYPFIRQKIAKHRTLIEATSIVLCAKRNHYTLLYWYWYVIGKLFTCLPNWATIANTVLQVFHNKPFLTWPLLSIYFTYLSSPFALEFFRFTLQIHLNVASRG